MTTRIGFCVNIDCEYFRREIEVKDGEEFCCPMCAYPLREKRVYGKKEKKIRIITN